jgi:hypothetical protein
MFMVEDNSNQILDKMRFLSYRCISFLNMDFCNILVQKVDPLHSI